MAAAGRFTRAILKGNNEYRYNYSLGESYTDGLTDLQREHLRMYEPPLVFAVISWGCAATSWTARVLNSHPDIFCVHASNIFWENLGGVPRLDGVEYMRIVGSQGYAHVAAGDVHGVSRQHIPQLRRAFGEKFNSAVVVREPLPRLLSQLALFERFEQFQSWDLGYVSSIIENKRIALPDHTYRSRFFVHAANMLNAILEEPDAGRIFRSEDLTQSPAVLREFIEELTRGKISPATEWLESALRTGRLNAHSRPGHDPKFADWQLEVIHKVVEPRSWEIYSQLGYSLQPEFA
jgi:hypothetical protein